MAKYLTNDTDLTAVADAIREKGGTSNTLVFPDGFVSAIEAIETTPVLQQKTITPTSSTQNITPDIGYDGLSLVTVVGDSDLVAANIKKDIEIFGVTGTYEEGVETCTLTLSSNGGVHNFSGYIYYLKLVNGDTKLAVTPELSTLNGSSIIDNIVKGSIIALTDIYHSYIPSYIESNDIGTNLIQVDSGNVFQIVGDVTLTGIYCFVEGSRILTDFNTSKPVEDITYDDDLLVWDFDNACFTYAKPCWIKKEETAPFYYKCTFLDGTELKLVGSNGKCHRVFSLDDNMFLSATDCVGKRVATINGASTLVSCERVDESVKYYNVITNHYINLFAENVLTSCRLNNMYPISDNKEYIKDGREVRPYSEFEAAGIKKYWYDALRLGESAATIKEITEYINRLEAKMTVPQDIKL